MAYIVLLGTVATLMVENAPALRWHKAETGVLVVDVAMMVAFATLTWFSNRFWPIWTTAFQLLSVTAHFGPMIRSTHIAIPFAVEEQIWSWVILAQLIVVTHFSRRSAKVSAERPSPTF